MYRAGACTRQTMVKGGWFRWEGGGNGLERLGALPLSVPDPNATAPILVRLV